MKYHFNTKIWTNKILTYYAQNKRDLPWRKTDEPYAIWISEVMSQQTRLETVQDYYLRFMETFPNIKSLAKAPLDQVLKMWEGLGYYSRAKNLHKTAQLLVSNHQSTFPSSYEELIQLPGIGPYTGAAMASICFNLVHPAIDGNFIRLATRIMAYDKNPRTAEGKRWLEDFWQGLIDERNPGDFNQAIMDLGAGICLPNGQPLCNSCPLSEICLAYQESNPLDYPIKVKKTKRRIEKKTILLLRDFEFFAMRQRDQEGLLAGLWEFPHLEGYLSQEETLAWLKDQGLIAWRIKKAPPSKHIFSHLEWHMISYDITLDPITLSEAKESDYRWVQAKDLDDLTVPKAFQTYLSYLLEKEEGHEPE